MCKIPTQQALYGVTRRGTEFKVKRSLHVHLISLVTNYLANSMDKTACSLIDICLSFQKILHILWNEEVHYHVLNIMPLVPLLNQMNLFHTYSPYFTIFFSRQIILQEYFCILLHIPHNL